MGKVAITYRIMPEGTEIDLAELSNLVKETLGFKLVKIEEKPVAFGLKAIMATVVIDDRSGEGETVEASLSSLPGVASVETQEMGLI